MRCSGSNAKISQRTRLQDLVITHDNRILDIADAIVYVEDGKLATAPDLVTAD